MSDEASVIGDYNQDGMVDAADYTVWRDNLSAVKAPGKGADGSGNGRIDEKDYSIWKSHYGNDSAAYRVELSWEAVPDAISYNIQRSSSAGGSYTTIETGVTGTHFSDPAPAGGGFYYVVSAVSAEGESQNSNEATPPRILQAEDATLSGINVVTAESPGVNPGYIGEGYTEFAAPSDGYIEWSVPTAQAGTHELAFRYSLGGASSRPLKLTVNGVVIEPSVDFSPANGGSTWQEQTVTVALAAGSNSVRLTSIGSYGANIDQLAVTLVDPVSTAASQLRRPISPEQPMWLIHIDTWNYADPQKIIDLIPEDIRPFVVMNIALSISHNAETSQFQVAEYGYEIAKSWLRVSAENQMWAIIQPSAGGYSQFSDFDLSVYEEFYRDYPNLIGFNYSEQFWGFDEADPLSAAWTDRITHFANLLELSHQYGGYLTVSWNGNQFSENINPIAMLKRNPAFAAATRQYTENYILCEKYTAQTYKQDMESLALGAYLSGYSGNYGIRYDETGWTDATGTHANFTLVTGAAPQLEHAMLTGQTVVDGPELIWLQDFRETNRISAGDGYTTRNWDTYAQFDNVSIDLFRKVLDGTVRIPSREEVIERTKVVVVNDVNVGSASTVYSSPQTLFEGLYQMDGNYANNKNFFKTTGRYPTVPTVFDLDDELANTFEVQVNRSDYNTRWPSIAAKVNEFNSLFPEEYTGDLFAGRHENGWVTYNPFGTGQTASGSIPFQYNTSDRMELTYSRYTTGIVKEYADSVTFYLNNYDNVLDTSLKTDTIKIYGSISQPTWSFADRGEHQPSIVTSDWTGGVFTLTVQHNGALDITVNCAGTATDRLTSYTPATIFAPDQPMVYTGPLQHEAEVFDYKSISNSSIVTSGYSGSVRNYTGQGYVQFGTSSTAAVRDTFTVLKDGNYRLKTRYSVPGANVNTIDLYVNGVNVGTPVFTQTSTYSDWSVNELNIPLNAGDNTIELRARATGASSIYIDNMVVVPTVYGDGIVIQENQSGFAGVDGTVDANQPGYVGAGFANTNDVVGAGIDWALNFDSSTVKSFTFRYASTTNRTADLLVNGVNVASNIQFPSTGSLSTWHYVTVYANVPAGYSGVRLQSTSTTGLPNIDSLEVRGTAPWVPGTTPFVPVELSATSVSISQIDLNWWASPGADTFNVMRASTSGGPYTTIATGVTGTSFSDTGLSELETYFYVVSAVNANGESADSTETSATTLSFSPPAAPTGVGAIAVSFDQVDVSWTASLGADSYIVKRSISSGGPYTTVAINVTGTSFHDSGLFAATTYYYVVSGVNSLGEGANSSQALPTTLSTATLLPIADSLVRDGGSVNTNFGADSTLVVKNDGGTGFLRNTFLKFDVRGLADAQNITLGMTPFQLDSAGVIVAHELVTDDSWTETGITWNNQPAGSGIVIANVSGYVVGQQKVTNVTNTAKSQAAGDGILSLKLSAANIGNNFTGFYSNETASSGLRPVLVATLSHVNYPPPAVPTNLVATAASTSQINLTWTAPAGATRYNIKRSTVSGGPYTLIAAGVSATSYSDAGLSEGTTYFYTISAVNGTGESPNSSEAFATPNNEYQQIGGVLSMEAEHGAVGSRWMTVTNAAASDGEYIEINPAYNHSGSSPASTLAESIATYEFNISTIGNQRFWFRDFAPNANDDSFFWRIDNGTWILENGRGGTGTWYSTDNAQVDNLSVGSHVLQIGYRENGTGLDKFVIQLDSLTAPTDSGPPESTYSAAPSGLIATAFSPSGSVEDFQFYQDATTVSQLKASAIEPASSSFAGAGAGVVATPNWAEPLTIKSAFSKAELISQPVRLQDHIELLAAAIQAEAVMLRTESASELGFSDEFLQGEEQREDTDDWLDDLAADLVSAWMHEVPSSL